MHPEDQILNPNIQMLTRRRGSRDVSVEIQLVPRHTQPQYKLTQPLADLLGLPQESCQGVLQALWVYFTTANLLVRSCAVLGLCVEG